MRRLDHPNTRPRGVLLLEAVIATTLLLAALAALLGVMSLLSRQKSQVNRREQAALLAANLMERLTADPSTLATGETTIALSEDDAPHPAGLTATLTVSSEPLDSAVESTLTPNWLAVQLRLQWPGPARIVESFRLATWVAPESRSEP